MMEKVDEQQAEYQANICNIFSNLRRIQILWALADGERSVGDIADAVDASLQNTSHHLRIMKDKGILSSHRMGRSIFYRISEPKLVDCLLRKAPSNLQILSVENLEESKQGINIDKGD
jgi:DNA-binding transcriptional ArsR family regulator